jgi:hypothetical protein
VKKTWNKFCLFHQSSKTLVWWLFSWGNK